MDDSDAGSGAGAAALLLEALEEAGAKLNGVTVRSCASLGAGLFATRSLSVGDVIAERLDGLTCEVALASPVGEALRGAGASPRSVLLMYLLACRYSEAALPALNLAYARSLPASCDLPVLWPEDEQESLLGGTELLKHVQRQRSLLVDHHRRLAKAIARSPSLFPPAHCGLDGFLWAHAVLSSRAFPASSLGGAEDEDATGVLIPLLDIGNHDAEGADISFEYGRDDGRVVMRRPVEAGAQIFGCYGVRKTSGQLLTSFGFCDWSGIAEVPLRVGAQFAETCDAATMRRRQALFRAVSGGELTFEITLRDGEPLPERLLQAARVCCLTTLEAAADVQERRARVFAGALIRRRQAQLLCGRSVAEWEAEASAARLLDAVPSRGHEYAVTRAGTALAYRMGAIRVIETAVQQCEV